jgi:purine-binding chemotaxis protein CheW
MYEERQIKNETKIVVFKLADEEFGAPIHQVHEILRLIEITRVPRAPRFIEGVINLRGKVIPVLDLRRRFDLPINENVAQHRIMEVEVEEQIIGVIVDAVTEVISLPVDAIEPPPPMIADIAGEYLTGVGKLPGRIIILLNFDKILTTQEARQIETTSLGALPGPAGAPGALPNHNQEGE